MSLALTVTDLEVANARGRALLSISHLQTQPGETIGIRGPSGAGKSTLLFALAGLIENARGSVCWGDEDILSQNASQRARFRAANVGLIFQDFLLFEELGPAANAALPALFQSKRNRPSIRERANQMLRHLGIADETRTVASFSGGERQRVAVARALANDPKIVLADEPTASLDRATADGLIADLIETARSNSTTLMVVSHDAGLLDQMNRVLTIEDGRLREGDHV